MTAVQPDGSSAGASNSSLHSARRAKNDEFYTQLTDIEKELQHYKGHFKDKVVFCNCDDPEWSNFWKYFTLNFEHLGLAKVVATHYASGESSYKLEYFGPSQPLVKTALTGDGDFRSPECRAILEEADIVVTNPPFSLFREYLNQLAASGKQFLIIGNNNAITYKEVFQLIQNNLVWMGVSPRSMSFKLPDGSSRDVNACWFTSLTHQRRNEKLILFKRYSGSEEAYPKYDNYDAIEVSKVADIPLDYDGEMGVPITFLDKYNPAQFEIIGSFNNGAHGADLGARKTTIFTNGKPVNWNGPAIKSRPLYKRIIIKRKA